MNRVDIPKTIRRLFSLHKIVADQDGTPEGENARRAMEAMMVSHDIVISDDDLKTIEVLYDREHDWEADLAAILAKATHVEAHVISDQIRFRGIKVAVDEASRHYEEHRDRMERLSGLTVIGYMLGAFEQLAMDHIKGSETSPTVQAGADEASGREAARRLALEAEPTKQEGEVVHAVSKIGMDHQLSLWKGLGS